MNKSALLASTALGLVLCITSANAQQKGPDEKAAPQQQEQGQSGRNTDPKAKGANQGEVKEQPRKGTAQTAPEGKGRAERNAEPKDKASKGTAEKAEPKGKEAKGAAEKAEPKDKGTKGSAEKAPQAQDKPTRGAGAEPKNKSGSANRVQLTEEKRTNVGQTLGKETNLNRATNVNVSVNIGTRLPRSVRLVALPASIIAIVPEYRTYRYVVINDQVCIVAPNTFEIVEVIPVSGQTASRSGHAERLVLTEEERTIILREVDSGGGSTMGLGAISEGADVPRDVRVQVFPDVVVQKVPKVKGYKFFTAENRVAIVDPQGSKVQLVLEHRR
jgi:hypothetical protein